MPGGGEQLFIQSQNSCRVTVRVIASPPCTKLGPSLWVWLHATEGGVSLTESSSPPCDPPPLPCRCKWTLLRTFVQTHSSMTPARMTRSRSARASRTEGGACRPVW